MDSKSAQPVQCDCNPKCVRKLGRAEMGLKHYGEFGDGVIACHMRLGSQIDLKTSDWLSAFHDILYNYPILSMTIGTCCCSKNSQEPPDTLYFKQLDFDDVIKNLVHFYRDRDDFPTVSETLTQMFEMEDSLASSESGGLGHVTDDSRPPSQMQRQSGPPLWQVKILHEFDSDRNTHFYTLGFCFCHVIADGASVIIILDHLYSLLNGKMSYSAVLPLMPAALEDQLAFTYIPWPVEPLADSCIDLMFRMNFKPWGFSASMKQYFKTFPPPPPPAAAAIATRTVKLPNSLGINNGEDGGERSTDGTSQENFHTTLLSRVIAPMDQRETILKVLKLSQQETAYFLRRCKQQKCSVTSALMVAGNIAFASLMQGGNLLRAVTVLTDVAVDLRRYIHAPLEEDSVPVTSPHNQQVFCATPMATLTFPCYVGKITGRGTFDFFWNKAKLISKALSARVKSREIIHTWNRNQKIFANRDYCMKMMEMAAYDSRRYGRFHHLFLSNMGNIDMDLSSSNTSSSSGGSNSGNPTVTLEDIQFGVSSCVLGNIFMNYVATINGQLNWNLCYFNHITLERDADAFVDLLKDVIVRFAIQGSKTK